MSGLALVLCVAGVIGLPVWLWLTPAPKRDTR